MSHILDKSLKVRFNLFLAILIISSNFFYLIRFSSSLALLLDIFNVQNKKSDSPKTNTINTININHFQNGIISPHFQSKNPPLKRVAFL